MNIFYLDYDINTNAEYHVDKHVVKMPTEAMQVVSTALRNLCSTDTIRPIYTMLHDLPLYKPTHFHHPLVQWASGSLDRAAFVAAYGIAVAREYEYRYGREILTMPRLKLVRNFIHELGGRPSPSYLPLCIPNEYKTHDPVESYRRYYTYAKAHLHKWTNRPIPYFISTCSGAATVGS